MYKINFILTKKLDRVMQFCCKYTNKIILSKLEIVGTQIYKINSYYQKNLIELCSFAASILIL